MAHDLPRTRWIVGDNAWLCDSRDRHALVAALAAALVDDGRSADRVASAAKFDWREIAARYRAFLTNILRDDHP